MGRLREELADPWGLLIAGVLGGVAGVFLGAGLLVGAGVAAAVYGVKVAAGTVLGGPFEPAAPAPPPRPPYGTPAAVWLKRAEDAVRSLHDMARGSASSPTDVATARAAEESVAVLETLRGLSGQSVALGKALAQASSPGLDAEAASLAAAAAAAPDDTSARLPADAVADRVAVRDRLMAATRELEARMQSSALGLEGLVARVAEIRATASTVGRLDPSADDRRPHHGGRGTADGAARRRAGSPPGTRPVRLSRLRECG